MNTKIKNKCFKKSSLEEKNDTNCVQFAVVGTVIPESSGAYYMTYAEQIKSPKWQKRRLEVLGKNNFTCQLCGQDEKELNVHHVNYDSKRKIWEYDDHELLVLCKSCHEDWHHNTAKLLQMLADVFTHINGFDFNDLDTFIRLLVLSEYDERRSFIKSMTDDIGRRLPL